jgi:5'(3')-deoxyribonucleotidase
MCTGNYDMGVLFISHSSKNNNQAIRVRDWLRSQGYAEVLHKRRLQAT